MNEIQYIQHLSLFPLVNEATQGLMSTSVATLLAISNGIEDAVIDHQLRGVFYAGFQRISSFMPQVERFAELAKACGEVIVFAEPDVAPPTIPGVNFVLLEPEAPLAEEWFIVFAHPALGVTLMTGPRLIAGVGSRARQEVTVLGDTVNTASRLQGLAPTGGVLMDETTYQACGCPHAAPKQVDVRGKRGRQSVYEIAPDEIEAILAALADCIRNS